MVNRELRDKAAILIRQFAAGHIANFEYDDGYPIDSNDPILHEVYAQIWTCYDDIKHHTLTGRHALKDDGKEFFHRCALFLESELEYEWPSVGFSLSAPILRLVGRKPAEVDESIWPFHSQRALDDARARYGDQSRFPEGPAQPFGKQRWDGYGNASLPAAFFCACAVICALISIRDFPAFRGPILFCSAATLLFSAIELVQRWRNLREDPHPVNYWF
jgi:hypothetical protein